MQRDFDKLAADMGKSFGASFDRNASPRIRKAADRAADAFDTARLKEAQAALQRQKAAEATTKITLLEREHAKAVRDSGEESAKASRLAKQLATQRTAHATATSRATAAETQHAKALRASADAQHELDDVTRASRRSTRRRGGAGMDLAFGLGVPGLAALTGAAITASGALGLIPSAAMGAGAALGTLLMGFNGFGQAITDLGDPKKFSEALQTLSPAAQQAALSIQNLMPNFKALQQATQDSLFQGVAEEIHNLTNQYLPTVQTFTTGVADSMNSMFKGFTGELMDPATQQQVGRMFSDIGQAFQNAAPAAQSFSSALIDIMSVGAELAPGLARSIADTAEKFERWIESARASRDLKRWITEGIDAAKQLGQIIWDAGRALASLAPVAMQVLPPIIDGVQSIADVLQDHPALIWAVIGAFAGWKTISGVSKLLESLGVLSASLGGLPGKADTAASGITKAFSRITLPTLILTVGLELAGPASDWLARNAPDVLQGLFPNAPIGNGPAIQSRMGPQFTPPVTPPDASVLWPGAGFPGNNTPRASDGDWGDPRVDRRGRNVAPLPDAGLPGYRELPVPPPPMDTGGSSSGGRGYSGYTSDEALLANVPAGRYSQTGAADLTEGIGDCTSAIEDLVALIDGNSTAGRSLSTANAHEWLTAHGFIRGMGGPGDFRVGFNSSHAQATLPGGTPFSWGSDNAAARRGIGGLGADDPSLTSHYYRPTEANVYRPFDYSRTTPVSVENFGPSAASTLQQQIGAPLDQDFGFSKGLPGIFENLFKMIANFTMAPVLGLLSGVTAAFGTAGPGSGILGAFAPRQNMFGQTVPGITGNYGGYGSQTGYTPGFTVRGASPGIPGLGTLSGPNGAPWGSPASGHGLGTPPGPGYASSPMVPGLPGAQPLSTGYAATESRGIMPGQGIPASSGIGLSGGGLLGMASSAASSAAGMAAGMFTGGGGGAAASAASQIGIDLMNRAIGFGGQAVGIGIQGLMDTFLPVESELADPSRGWIGRIMGAVAGVRPAAENVAGSLTESTSGPNGQMDPEEWGALKASLAKGKAGKADKADKAKGGGVRDINTTVNNYGATPDANGAAVQRHAIAAAKSAGR